MNAIIENKKEVMDKIDAIKSEYYNDNKKNRFFKKTQKLDCASIVANQVDLTTLVSNTFYLIPNTNILHIDYTIFKTFVNPDNYLYLSVTLIDILNYCKEEYGSFEIYINLDTLTVSGLERYKETAFLFMQECDKRSLIFAEFAKHISFYNNPNFINMNKSLMYNLMTKEAVKKVKFYSKTESDVIIEKLNNIV